MLKPRISTTEDLPQWISLAKEVEPMFGPMVEDPGFREGLQQAISDGNAFCVGRADGENGQALQGGIVISREANEILWLAAAQECRGQGIGKALLEEAMKHLDQGRPVLVTTFDGSVQAGLPARSLYQAHGFRDSQPAGLNPAGIPTVVMIR